MPQTFFYNIPFIPKKDVLIRWIRTIGNLATGSSSSSQIFRFGYRLLTATNW